jgi:tetratricopeptide (TPR) repeat protein/adenylylsulfate kinase-like enzyme
VVADAAEVTVRFNAKQTDEWSSSAEVSFLAQDSAVDLAVLSIEARRDEPPVWPVVFGRVPVTDILLRVTALGYPRFKLRDDSVADEDGKVWAYRDSHHMAGTVAALSNRKQGTFEITVIPPDRDPDPQHSPWEGMSGAAVFAGGHLVGLVSEHHRADGLGRVTATRVDQWVERLGEDRLAELRLHVALPALLSVAAPWHARRRPGVALPPGVPSTHIDRPRERDAVVAELVAASSSPEMAIVGLVGMPGSGKSVLARAVAADERVTQHFGDRVVWLDVGREPDLIRAQGRLAEAFGDSRPITDIERGCDQLRDLLAGSPCLIVLDNVWLADHLRTFDFRHPEITLLVTTRSQAALFAGVTVFSVGAVERAQSRQVLARYAGVSPSNLPSVAGEVAAVCGDLVLALAIAGGMVAEGRGWDRVLHRLRCADLGKLAATLRDYPYGTLLRAIDASVTDLTDEQRTRFLELAVFDNRVAVPLVAAESLWQISGMFGEDAEDLLIFLDRRSLVQRDRHRQTFTLHDMISVYVRSQVDWATARDLHGRFADGFLDEWGGLAANLPSLRAPELTKADEYAVGQLASHLSAAERFTDIDLLLALEWEDGPGRMTNVWYAVHERLGLIAAYQSDVRQVWSRAVAGQPDFAAELRYALMIGSIASITANLPAELIVCLVEATLWSPQQALAVVATMPDEQSRAACLRALVPVIPSSFVDESIAIASTLGPYGRAMILGHLISVGVDSAEDLADLTARAVRDIGNPLDRAQAAGELADMIPDLADVAMTAAEELTTPWDRAVALMNLAHAVPAVHLVDRIWHTLLVADQDPYWQARAMIDMVPLLTPHQLRDALRLVSANPDPEGRARVLVLVAPLLREGDGWFDDCLRAVAAVRNDQRLQADLYAALAEHLPEPLFPALLDAVATIPDGSAQAHALAEILPCITESLRQSVCTTVLELADRMDQNTVGQAEVLTAVAASLDGERRADVVERVLSTIMLIADPTIQARTFRHVTAMLPDELSNQAVTVANAIADPFCQAQVLTALALSSPPARARQFLLNALVAVRTVRCEPWRSPVASAAFSAALPDDERTERARAALVQIRNLDDEVMREHALGVVAPLLPDVLRDGRASDKEAYEAAAVSSVAVADATAETVIGRLTASDAPAPMIAIMSCLAPHLTEEASQWAWDQAMYGDTTSWVATLAGELAPLLSEQEAAVIMAELEALFEATPTVDAQLDLLVQIALSFGNVDAAAAALDTIPFIMDSARQAEALKRLAPALPHTLHASALDAIRYVAAPEGRVEALVSLAEQLRPEELPAAMEVAAHIDVLDGRALVVTEIAFTSRRIEAAQPERYWRAALESAAPAGREMVLEVATRLASAFSDSDTARRALCAVQDVERWWPAGATNVRWLGDRPAEQAVVGPRAPSTDGQVFVPGLLDGDPVTDWDQCAMEARGTFTERLLANYPSRKHIPTPTRVEYFPVGLWSASVLAVEQMRITTGDKWYAGRYVEAMEELTMLIKTYPNEPTWQNYRGQILGDLGYATLAISDLDAAMTLNPRGEVHAYALSARGYAYGTLGRLEQAFQDFDESLQAAPENAWTFFRRGLLRFALSSDAEGDLRASLAMAGPALNPLQMEKARWIVRKHFDDR